MEYNFKEIEKKWQKYWEDNNSFKAVTGDKTKDPYYILVEFPYPSGAGLHVGHVRSYTAQDAIARMKRMQGKNVLYPMGWDAFGAPAEQYAIKNHIHPKEAVKENIKTFKTQMKTLGFSFDWSREFSTTDPEYYKWTQWQFLQFYKHNMAYKDTIPVNWCPTCKTVLSNEDAAGGVCERCGSAVVQKEKSQWMLKMSSYAEDLLKGLDDTNFAERVKLGQINWIGKSTGVEVDIDIVGGGKFSIFTTCIETIYGITFFVIAPDGKLIKELMPRVENKEEVEAYIKETSMKSDMDRTELNKGKSGCLVKGIEAINPVNGKKVTVTKTTNGDSTNIRFKVSSLNDTIKVKTYVVPMSREVEFGVELLKDTLTFIKEYTVDTLPQTGAATSSAAVAGLGLLLTSAGTVLTKKRK